MTLFLLQSPLSNIPLVVGIVIGVIVLGLSMLIVKCYRKVPQGTGLIRTGMGGVKVTTSHGMIVIPVLHRAEYIDISVKRIEINREGKDGLICKDNMRADIKVAFFVRVNNTPSDILQVAQSLGCQRASEQRALVELFDAKFSEALKTVGKQFNFVDLYNQRDRFKEEIIEVIGTDLNGYVLDDSAIDYLEQTALDLLDMNNILDAEGIKKITELTAKQQILANNIQRDKEKVITKQNVEAREVILQLEKQQAEAEEKQRCEVESIKARQQAEIDKTREEERKKAELARLATEEDLQVSQQNLERQVIVAQKNKERTDAVESERIEKDRLLEVTERERIVSLAQIEKDKAIEIERKEIQDVIRERVAVQRAVVEEEERIKDTQEFAAADRKKQVTVTAAEEAAEQTQITEVAIAEASMRAASKLAEQQLIEAEANRAAAEKDTEAKKMLAEARAAEEAAMGLAEAEVIRAKADAHQKQGETEAKVMQLKYTAEAQGIEEKANAMKILDGVGKEHEEFKLRLEKDKDVELAAIHVNKDIAEFRAQTVGEALKSATIDIVGGESTFFDKIVGAVGNGKAVDRTVKGSDVLRDVKETFFNGNPDYFRNRLEEFISQFGIGSEDVKNLSIAALIGKMMSQTDSPAIRRQLEGLLGGVQKAGLAETLASSLDLKLPASALS